MSSVTTPNQSRHKMIPKPCEHCGKITLMRTDRKEYRHYCSMECRLNHTNIRVNCAECNKELIRKLSRKGANKTGFWYCNLGHRNKHRARLEMADFYAQLQPEAVAYIKASKTIDTRSQRTNRVRALLRIHNPISCSNCGCNLVGIIEINHRNGGGVKEFKAGGNDRFYRGIAKGIRKTDDLDLRCRVCNTLYDVELRHKVKGFTVTFAKEIEVGGPKTTPPALTR